MKVIKEYPSKIDADIARGFLETEGIVVFISTDDRGGVGGVSIGLKPAKLAVPDDDVERALDILNRVDPNQ